MQGRIPLRKSFKTLLLKRESACAELFIMKKKKHRFHDDVTEYEYLFQEQEVRGKKKSRFFGRMIKKNFWAIFLSSLIYIIKASPIWITPIVTSNIINVITQYVSGAITRDAVIRSVVINAAVFTVMMVQNIPMHMLWAKICSKMFRDNSANTRSAVVRKLQRLSITYHKEMETGKVQSKFLRDVENVDMLVSHMNDILLPSVFGVLISVGISLYKSGVVTLFFLVVIPVNVLLALLFRKKMSKNSRMLRKDSEAVANKLSTMLEMLTVTKAHGLEDKEYNDFQTEIKRLRKTGRSLDMTNAYFGSVAWVLSNLLSGVCLIFCAYLAFGNKIKVGDIVLYQSLFASINGNVLTLINIMPQMLQGSESVHSISEIMNAADIEETHIGKNLPEIAGEVDFDRVSYRYPDSDNHVVKDFSLHVDAGECIAVVGGSGSGKSTLMNMIIGFLKPESGTLSVDGKSLAEVNLSEYRHFISVVPQNSILFAGSIRDNITYGLDGYTEEELNRVVELANIEEFVKDFPAGIDTQIGEHGGRLSGGQKQRITIARALIRNPRILILDEATSALDNISEYHVQKAISSLIKGRTTFIVAHRLSTIRDADRIVVMENGEAVEIGTYDELMEKRGKFYELKNLNDISYREAAAALES